MRSIKLNGVNVYVPSSSKELIDYSMMHKKILVAVNAEKILHANTKSREIINKNIGYPDGMGAVWALKKKGFSNAFKIPGCELWLDIIARCYKSKTFYLLGGKQRVIDKTILKLKEEFIGINILNYRNGYIKNEEERKSLIKNIVGLAPDIIFVAMGSPKQEMMMEDIKKKHCAVFQGLGGSFDVYIGEVNRAPNFFIDNNIEWAYRLIKQPSRIIRQIHLLHFLILLKLKKF